MSFIIQGSNNERTVYVGKPGKEHFNITTNQKIAKKFHFVAGAERYAKRINVLFDLFPEYEWKVLDTDTGETHEIEITPPVVVDIDEVDENSIRCNY